MKDKIIFWLGVDYTPYCLAYSLQQKYDCDMYAIIDITKKPRKFFETQKLVDFKNNSSFSNNMYLFNTNAYVFKTYI